MRIFSDEQRTSLMAEVDEIMNRIADDMPVTDVLAQIYVRELDNKTERQGQVIAQAILANVKSFDSDFSAAQENLDEALDKMLDGMNVGDTCAERCTNWKRMAAAISAVTVDRGEGLQDRESVLREIEAIRVEEEDANPRTELNLRNEVKKALRGAGVLLTELGEQENAWEALEQQEIPGVIIDLGNRQFEYRAVLTMLAYTRIKKGEFGDVPVDMSVEEVTNFICADIEQIRILDALEHDSLPINTAIFLLDILGTVVLLKFTIKAIMVTGSVAAAVFGSVLCVPAVILMGIELISLFSKFSDGWSARSRKLVKRSLVLSRTIARTLKSVCRYIKENFVSEGVERAKGFLASLREKTKAEAEAAGTEGQTVAVPVAAE